MTEPTNRDRALAGEVVTVTDSRLLEMQRQTVTHEGICAEPIYHWHWAAVINELIAARDTLGHVRRLADEIPECGPIRALINKPGELR